MTAPKVFISYSWTTPDHEAWVLQLATDLVDSGIEVIIDKWDLGKGHDANAFMEQMATKDDIKKVAMICDRGYTEKANSRKGGAGTEAQIITPQIYTSQDQNKFVAVLSERDEEGKPYVPAFYSSRIYIDLSDPTTYGTGFEELVRWAFDKPLYVKPALGKPPAYISDNADTVRLGTSTYQKKAVEAVRSGRPNAPAVLSEYFDKLLDEMEKFRLQGANRTDFDIQVLKSIDDFLPYRNEFFEAVSVAINFMPNSDTISRLHKFFEQLIRYMHRSESMTGWSSWDFDNYKFLAYEMYLGSLAILIKFEQFDLLKQLVDTEYFVGNIPDIDGNEMMGPDVFMHHLESFEAANRRSESKKITMIGDVLHNRSKHTYYEFRHLCAVDIILHLRDRVKSKTYVRWYAVTPIYLTYSRSSLEVFARSRSSAYFSIILQIIGLSNADEFRNLITRLQSTERGGFGFGHYHRGASLSALVNAENVATSP